MIDYDYLSRFLLGLAIVLAYTYAAFEYTTEPEVLLLHDARDYLNPWEEPILPPVPESEEPPIPITTQEREAPPLYQEFSHEELTAALKDIVAEEEEECAPLKTVSVQNEALSDEEREAQTMWIYHEESATPIGGMKAFYKFLKDEMRYPKEAKEAGIEGKVFLSFIVTIDGTLRCIDVVRGIHPALDAEALRVMALSPKWIPAKSRGRIMEGRYYFPINFRLPDDTK